MAINTLLFFNFKGNSKLVLTAEALYLMLYCITV